MKRLIKKAFGKELYHGTSVESFFSILNSGALYPQETQASDWAKPENIKHYFFGDEEAYHKHMDNYEGFTFFATDYYTAKEYGARAMGKSEFNDIYVVLRADVSEDALMPDLNDSPNSKTWQESENDVGQVSVLGPVTMDYIKGVSFIFKSLHVELDSTIANWQTDVKAALAQEVRRGYLDIDDCYELWDKLGIPHNAVD